MLSSSIRDQFSLCILVSLSLDTSFCGSILVAGHLDLKYLIMVYAYISFAFKAQNLGSSRTLGNLFIEVWDKFVV